MSKVYKHRKLTEYEICSSFIFCTFYAVITCTNKIEVQQAFVVLFQALVKSAYQKINFLISQPKHLLWVLKRTVSLRRKEQSH